MSRLTLRVVDLYCAVWNENALLAHAYPDEIERWSKGRDRKLELLRRAVAKLTPDEITFLRKHNQNWDNKLAEIGAPLAP